MEAVEGSRNRIELGGLARALGPALAVGALLGALSGYGAGRLLGHFLALPEGAGVEALAGAAEGSARTARRRHRESTPVASKRLYAEAILSRNIFDSSAVGTEYQEVAPGEEGRRSDLKAVLLATVVADPPEYSSCLIRADEKDAPALGYGIGDELLGEATIIDIRQKKVIIRRHDGTVEYIAMGEESGEHGGRVSGSAGEQSGEGITKTGDNSWVVDQSVVDSALADIDRLVTQVRAIPHRGPDGEIDGFRLSAIRRGSLLYKLGIKNGDVVHSVNGQPLTSASGAMAAFQALQNERTFEFEITRRGKRQTFQYEIR